MKIIEASITKKGKEVFLLFEGTDIDGNKFHTSRVVKVKDYYD